MVLGTVLPAGGGGGGGSTSPGGSNKSVQFNNNGIFDGSNDYQWDDTAKTLTINGQITGTYTPVHDSRKAYVTEDGDDDTGTVGNPSLPFATPEACEAAIPDASSSKQYMIIFGSGSFDVTGLVKKLYIHWHSPGEMLTEITEDDNIFDVTNPIQSSSSAQMSFTGFHFRARVTADLYAIGGAYSSQYIFDGCLFDRGHNVTGRGGNDQFVFKNQCVTQSTPSNFTSVSLELWDHKNTGDGGGSFNISAANGNGAQAFVFGGGIFCPLNVTSDAFCLVLLRGTSVSGLITADQATTTIYMDDGCTLGADPVKTNGANIIQLSRASQEDNDSSVPGETTKDALNALLDMIQTGTFGSDQITDMSDVDAGSLTAALNSLFHSNGTKVLFTGTGDATNSGTDVDYSIVPTGIGSVNFSPDAMPLAVGDSLRVQMAGHFYIPNACDFTFKFVLRNGDGDTVLGTPMDTVSLSASDRRGWWAEAVVTIRALGDVFVGTMAVQGFFELDTADGLIKRYFKNRNPINFNTSDENNRFDILTTLSAANDFNLTNLTIEKLNIAGLEGE